MNEQQTQILGEDGSMKSRAEQVHSYSINSSLIQFKVIHRTHYSKTKLHRYNPRSPICDKCSLGEANLLHSLTLCPKIENYWSELL